jgi:hypothetical protein
MDRISKRHLCIWRSRKSIVEKCADASDFEELCPTPGADLPAALQGPSSESPGRQPWGM